MKCLNDPYIIHKVERGNRTSELNLIIIHISMENNILQFNLF